MYPYSLPKENILGPEYTPLTDLFTHIITKAYLIHIPFNSTYSA